MSEAAEPVFGLVTSRPPKVGDAERMVVSFKSDFQPRSLRIGRQFGDRFPKVALYHATRGHTQQHKVTLCNTHGPMAEFVYIEI